MKKLNALFLAISVMTASLYSANLSVTAQEELILTRDENGNFTMSTSENNALYQSDPENTAESTQLIPDEHGNVLYYHSYISSHTTAFFITDENGFQNDYIEHSWISNMDRFFICEEITPDNLESFLPKDSGGHVDVKYQQTYTAFYMDLLSQYGSNSRLYQFQFKQTLPEEFNQLFRESMLKFDGLLDVVYMGIDTIGSACWDGSFTLGLNKEYEGFYTNKKGAPCVHLPDEIKIFLDEQKQIYTSWNAAYTAWMDSIDADSMTPAQLELSRIEAGVASDAEMLQKANEACEWLETEYSHVFTSAAAPYSLKNYEETICPVSVWESVGDIDEDGKISAADAALLLQAAAAQGTGEEIDIPIEIADVNADYVCNASDAALLLSYAAQKGAGADLSLKDFMKTLDISS